MSINVEAVECLMTAVCRERVQKVHKGIAAQIVDSDKAKGVPVYRKINQLFNDAMNVIYHEYNEGLEHMFIVGTVGHDLNNNDKCITHCIERICS